jgi:hypothetical protein
MRNSQIIDNNLDYIMEHYFNTDKEVMYLCDYDTVQEILEYAQYRRGDFSDYFAIELSCEYNYYSVYKNGNEALIIEYMTNLAGELYPEYGADYILIQEDILDKFGRNNILDRCEEYKEIGIICEDTYKDDEDNILYGEFADLLEDYVERISEIDGCPMCIKDNLMDFAIDLLGRFRVVEK